MFEHRRLIQAPQEKPPEKERDGSQQQEIPETLRVVIHDELQHYFHTDFLPRLIQVDENEDPRNRGIIFESELQEYIDQLSNQFDTAERSDVWAELFQVIIDGIHNGRIGEAQSVALYDTLLSSSPSIVNYLSLTDRVRIGAALRRDPQAQSLLLQPVSGELMYDLSYLKPKRQSEFIERMSAQLESASAGEALDTISYFVGLSRGIEHWQLQGFDLCDRLLQTVADKRSQPMIDLFVQVSRDEIARARAMETDGAPAAFDEVFHQRVHKRQQKQWKDNAILSTQIVVSPPYDTNQYQYRRISTDAIGIFDRGGFMHATAELPENLPEPQTLIPEPGPRSRVIPQRSANVPENRVRVDARPLSAVLDDSSGNPFGNSDVKDPVLVGRLYDAHVTELVANRFGIELAEFSFKQQVHFLEFLSLASHDQVSQLDHVIEKKPMLAKHILQACIVGAGDHQYISTLINVVERQIESDQIPEVLTVINDYADRSSVAIQEAVATAEKIQLPEAVGRSAVIERLRQFLDELVVADGDDESMQSAVTALNKESIEDTISVALLRSIAFAFGRGTDVIDKQQWVEQLSHHREGDDREHRLLLNMLQRMGSLKPVPEIHWRVDRTPDEYRRRFGFDVLAYLGKMGDPSKKKLLLEYGPGNGFTKRARAAEGLGDMYHDFAIANTVYFPLDKLIARIIDFDALETQVGVLSQEERKLLAEFVYKTAVIAEGQGADDRFAYDTQLQDDLARNVNTLTTHFDHIQQKLAQTLVVPQTISEHAGPGETVYPYKIRADQQTENWQRARELLAGRFTDFIRPAAKAGNMIDFVEAFPEGVMVGDFDNVSSFADEAVDASLASRSTVYKRGQEYVTFLRHVARTLTAEGVHIDDSIRDNDGYRHRILELKEVMSTLDGVQAHVIIGPGFDGENDAGKVVPLAMILSKKLNHAAAITNSLDDGYEMLTLTQAEDRFPS